MVSSRNIFLSCPYQSFVVLELSKKTCFIAKKLDTAKSIFLSVDVALYLGILIFLLEKLLQAAKHYKFLIMPMPL